MGIGDIIKKRRLELGMTQRELANDICTQALISRIEHNEIMPKKDILDQIEKRLDFQLSELSIIINLNTTQHKIDTLIAEIRDYMLKRDYPSIALLMKYNTTLIKNIKNINDSSFFQWIEATLMHQIDGDKEGALHLFEGIQLDELDNELSIEIKNAIGLIYYQSEDFEVALQYFSDAIKGLNPNLDFKIRVKVLFNYALTLEESGENNEALSVILSGIDILLEHDSLYLLGDFYYTKGFIFNKMNNPLEALDNFEIALSLFKIQNNNRFYDYTQMAISDIKNKVNTKEDSE